MFRSRSSRPNDPHALRSFVLLFFALPCLAVASFGLWRDGHGNAQAASLSEEILSLLWSEEYMCLELLLNNHE